MIHEVVFEQVDARPLAAIRGTTSRARLARDILRNLDVIWPLLRARGVRTRHNVVIYRGGTEDALHVEIGVEVLSEFAGTGEVVALSTPSGAVATTAHYGDYSTLSPAYAAIDRALHERGRRSAGVTWEVYGDWEDDPALRRTDIFFLLRDELQGDAAPPI